MKSKREYHRKYNKKPKRIAWRKEYDSKRAEYWKKRGQLEERKKLAVIKRRTSRNFPLTNQKCKICSKPAEEHHHITIPYEFDKFIFVCRKCHKDIHSMKEVFGEVEK